MLDSVRRKDCYGGSWNDRSRFLGLPCVVVLPLLLLVGRDEGTHTLSPRQVVGIFPGVGAGGNGLVAGPLRQLVRFRLVGLGFRSSLRRLVVSVWLCASCRGSLWCVWLFVVAGGVWGYPRVGCVCARGFWCRSSLPDRRSGKGGEKMASKTYSVSMRKDSFDDDSGKSVEYDTMLLADPKTGEVEHEMHPKAVRLGGGGTYTGEVRSLRAGAIFILDGEG